ncbi:NADPH-dependent FMN reductase [Paenibacillus sp. TH7-28]
MKELAPKHWESHHVDLSTIPLYNSDIESQGDPQSVVDFKESIRKADGVLIVTLRVAYTDAGSEGSHRQQSRKTE